MVLELGSFRIILIDSLLVYQNNNYLQVCLEKCIYKIVNTQMVDNLGDNLFESNES